MGCTNWKMEDNEKAAPRLDNKLAYAASVFYIVLQFSNFCYPNSVLQQKLIQKLAANHSRSVGLLTVRLGKRYISSSSLTLLSERSGTN